MKVKPAILLIPILIVIFLLFYFRYDLFPSPGKIISDKYFTYCKSDYECISVPDGSCHCGNSGKATAINKAKEVEWEEKRVREYPGQICLTMPSNDPSCRATPRCIRNACRLI